MLVGLLWCIIIYLSVAIAVGACWWLCLAGLFAGSAVGASALSTAIRHFGLGRMKNQDAILYIARFFPHWCILFNNFNMIKYFFLFLLFTYLRTSTAFHFCLYISFSDFFFIIYANCLSCTCVACIINAYRHEDKNLLINYVSYNEENIVFCS